MRSSQISEELASTGVAQIIVVLKEPTAAASNEAEGLRKHFVTTKSSQNAALAMSMTESSMLRLGARRNSKGKEVSTSEMQVFPHLGLVLGTVSREGLAALRADKTHVDEIVGAPQIGLIRPKKVESAPKPRRKISWGIEALKVPSLWKRGLTGKGVLIAHLDTGIDGKHPAFKGAISSFAVFDDFGQEITPHHKAYDTDDHGTHTAATIAGRPVGGFSMGVAPGAKLASAAVIEGGNVIARVLGGMDWAVGMNVRIINMSLGFRGYKADFLPLTQLLRKREILPIFAIGNEGPGTSRSPGNYVEAISVGAVDSEGFVADFSSSHLFKRKKESIVPDICAPGVDIISARPGGGFQAMDGTSMATPHISGLAALLLEAKPDATLQEIEDAIFGSCSRRADVSAERGNRGMPDAEKAFTILTGGK